LQITAEKFVGSYPVSGGVNGLDLQGAGKIERVIWDGLRGTAKNYAVAAHVMPDGVTGSSV